MHTLLMQACNKSWSIQRLKIFRKPVIVHARVMHQSPFADTLRRKDGLPDSYRLIYRAPMYSYISALQTTASVSIVFGCVWTYSTVYNKYVSLDKVFEFNEFIKTEAEYYIFAAAFLGINFLIYKFLLMYPVRIYTNDKESYIGIFPNTIPTYFSQREFSPKDIAPRKIKDIWPWSGASFAIHKRPVIILEDFFYIPADFNKMLSRE